jgi:hypothetical protein
MTERTPTLWSCDDGEDRLHCDDRDKAVEEFLEQQIDTDMSDAEVTRTLQELSPLKVFGYAPQVAKLDTSWLLERVLEDLDSDQELGDPDGAFEPTPRMKGAAELFCKTILEEYHVWAHDVVVTEEVDCVAWAQEHCPSWFGGD